MKKLLIHVIHRLRQHDHGAYELLGRLPCWIRLTRRRWIGRCISLSSIRSVSRRSFEGKHVCHESYTDSEKATPAAQGLRALGRQTLRTARHTASRNDGALKLCCAHIWHTAKAALTPRCDHVVPTRHRYCSCMDNALCAKMQHAEADHGAAEEAVRNVLEHHKRRIGHNHE